MAETIPTCMPGDFITYVVYLAYPGNIRKVTATFHHEQVDDARVYVSGGPIEYGESWNEAHWEAQLISDPRIEGTRTHVVVLSEEISMYDVEKSTGRYRLKNIEVTTYGNKNLTIDRPPSAAFRIEAEPDISVLPSSAVLPPTGFHFPEGHPDRPQGE